MDGAAGTADLDVGTPVATGVHQVDNPAFGPDGTLYATFSGTRGQRVPVSVFRVADDGEKTPFADGPHQRDLDGVRSRRRAARDQPVRRHGAQGPARRHVRDRRPRPRRGLRHRLRIGRDHVRRRPQRHGVPRRVVGPRRAVRVAPAEPGGVPSRHGPRRCALRDGADHGDLRPRVPRRSAGRRVGRLVRVRPAAGPGGRRGGDALRGGRAGGRRGALPRAPRAPRGSWWSPPPRWSASPSTRAAGWSSPPTTPSIVSTTGCGPGEPDEAPVRRQVPRPDQAGQRGAGAAAQADAGPGAADGARHRRDHGRRHLLDDRVGGGRRRLARGRRARHHRVVRPDGDRVRLRGPLLRGVRRHGPHLGLGLHLRLRDARRGGGLDHRLGPDPRVRRRQRGGRDFVVGLLPRAARRLRHLHPRLAVHRLPDGGESGAAPGRAPGAGRRRRRPRHRRHARRPRRSPRPRSSSASRSS